MTAADAADLRAITEADVYLGDEIVASLRPPERTSFLTTPQQAPMADRSAIARYRGHFS